MLCQQQLAACNVQTGDIDAALARLRRLHGQMSIRYGETTGGQSNWAIRSGASRWRSGQADRHSGRNVSGATARPPGQTTWSGADQVTPPCSGRRPSVPAWRR
jgi:hypothetical protein